MNFLCVIIISLFILSLVKCEDLNTEKVLNILDRMNGFDQEMGKRFDDLILQVHTTQEDVSVVLFGTIIETDVELFFAIKSALKYEYMDILEELIKYGSQFDLLDQEVDFFILLQIPRLNLENPESTIKILFGTELRGGYFINFTNTDCPKIGTISMLSLKKYIEHLWINPELLPSHYPIYKKHLHQYFLNPLKSVHSIQIQVFDLFIENDPQLIFDKNGLSVLKELSFTSIESYCGNEVVMNRLFHVYTKFFIEFEGFDECFVVMLHWNISFAPLKRAFWSVYENDFENVLFRFLKVIAMKFDYKSCDHDRQKYELVSLVTKVLDLSPYELVPLKNYELSQNLITRFLYLALDLPYNAKLSACLIVIDSILKVLGSLPEWPKSIDMTGCLDEKGIIDTNVLWIITNVPALMPSINPKMVLSETFQCMISDSYSSVIPFACEHSISDFHERLFGLFDVKAEFRIILAMKVSIKKKIDLIKQFMKLFRAESDFILISKLPINEQKERYVDVQHCSTSTGGFFYASVYKFEEDQKNLIVKMILAIDNDNIK